MRQDGMAGDPLVTEGASMDYGRRAFVPRIETHALKRMGYHLQAHFEDTVREPLPERLRELLDRLDEK